MFVSMEATPLVDFVNSDSEESHKLREKYCFKNIIKYYPHGRYLLVTHNHIAYMDNGEIYDNENYFTENSITHIIKLSNKTIN
jgi:hypothetical protein